MREAVLVDMIRTPFGRAGQRGVFRDISHVEMVVPLMKNVLARNNVGGEEVDEVLWGSVGIAGMLTRSRLYVLEAGLPYTISATDMNKQCGSSLQASAQGAFAVMAGMSDVVIAGGVETMDRVNPIPPGDETNLQQVQTSEVMAKEFLQPWPDKDKAPVWQKRWYQVTEPWIMDMGQTAEKLAKERGVSREDADRFSLESHRKTIRAQKEGLLADEINPIEISYSDGSSVKVETDQNPRENTSLEKLTSLKPAYTADGQVTAGNASPRTDGATVCLIMEKQMAKEKGLKPLATFRHAASVGVDPTIMGIGPVPATQKLLKRSGMTLDDFDIIEINEAFACQVLACGAELKWDWDKVNPNGGAIAIGHPLGATGTRLLGTIAYEMRRRDAEWGLVTLCMGAGMGMSLALQREHYDW
ncbi:MAG: thiolase family protein [Chloroflexi bacterium]|nr:thiolase family protein [Chloroflexota bacterium]